MFLQCYFYMNEAPLLIICCLLIPCLFYGSIFGCLLVSHAEKTSICAQVTSCKSKAQSRLMQTALIELLLFFLHSLTSFVCIVHFMSMNVIFLCKACIIFSSLFFQKNRLILVQFWFYRCLERAIIAGLSGVSYDNKFCKCHSFGHCCNSEPH